MRAVLAIALVALVALAGVSVAAEEWPSLQKGHCNGKDYGKAGDFDYYVFAQSWSAQFCTAHKDWPGCRNPEPYMRTSLTLHGLWPNYGKARDGHGWPQCCPTPYGSDVDPAVVQTLLPYLQQYWPNEQEPTGRDLTNSLWNHEWGKHGTCSGLTQMDYFRHTLSLHSDFGRTPKVIQDAVGKSASLAEMRAAYGASNCKSGGDCPVAFHCEKDKATGRQYLGAVSQCFNPKLGKINCSWTVQQSQGPQCVDERIYIRAFPVAGEQEQEEVKPKKAIHSTLQAIIAEM